MTLPDPGLQMLQLEVRHQNGALERIEKKIDKVTDDHESRLRVHTTSLADHASRLKTAEEEMEELKTRLGALEASDKRWAALTVMAAAALQVIFKLVWP